MGVVEGALWDYNEGSWLGVPFPKLSTMTHATVSLPRQVLTLALRHTKGQPRCSHTLPSEVWGVGIGSVSAPPPSGDFICVSCLPQAGWVSWLTQKSLSLRLGVFFILSGSHSACFLSLLPFTSSFPTSPFSLFHLSPSFLLPLLSFPFHRSRTPRSSI